MGPQAILLLEVLLEFCWVLACLHEAVLGVAVLELQAHRGLEVLQQSLWGSALEFLWDSGTSNAGSGGTATFTAFRVGLLITINWSSPSTGSILSLVLGQEGLQ